MGCSRETTPMDLSWAHLRHSGIAEGHLCSVSLCELFDIKPNISCHCQLVSKIKDLHTGCLLSEGQGGETPLPTATWSFWGHAGNRTTTMSHQYPTNPPLQCFLFLSVRMEGACVFIIQPRLFFFLNQVFYGFSAAASKPFQGN